jgi:predicted TIM-barrel fold metal-dependent hydrolase
MLTNADYRATELARDDAERKALRLKEMERRTLLDSQRDYLLIDADQHYYEPDDCFTRHLEPKYLDQAIEVRRDQPDGRGRLYLAGKRFSHLPGPPGENIGRPGILREYFKNKATDVRNDHDGIQGLAYPEFTTREARYKALDTQNVQACLMLPTTGLLVENECCRKLNPDAWYALMRSFNRWLEEDWGYGSDGRLFGVPLVSLLDPDLAVAELERLIELGPKVVLLRAGPLYGRSPADPIFDPFWARVQEANLIVAFHIGDFGYLDFYATEWGYGKDHFPAGAGHPFETLICGSDRAISDTIGALIFGELFNRFPQLRCTIVELGAYWLPGLLKKMDMIWRNPTRSRADLDEPPSVIYKRHFWICPYYEDNWRDIIESVGTSRVLLGSDWPHPEGLPVPLDMLEELGQVPDQDVRLIMRDNTASLLGIGGL